jgi:hypothetical protein
MHCKESKNKRQAELHITTDKRASSLPAVGRQIVFLSAWGHLPAPIGAWEAGGSFFYPQAVK